MRLSFSPSFVLQRPMHSPLCTTPESNAVYQMGQGSVLDVLTLWAQNDRRQP